MSVCYYKGENDSHVYFKNQKKSSHIIVSQTSTNCSPVDIFHYYYGGQKGKVFPYSLPSIEPGADSGVQAVSPQVTLSHPPGGRLALLFARPVVTLPAKERYHTSASTKLYCLNSAVARARTRNAESPV